MDTEQTDFKPDIEKDIPIAYAVFEPIWDEDKNHIIDMRFVFANQKYCLLCNKTKEELKGNLLSECYEIINTRWYDFCYEAIVNHKTTRNRLFSTEINHWLEFDVSPTSDPSLCAFTFLDVDIDTVQKINLQRARKTDSTIIRLTSVLVNPVKYDTAIQQVLEEMSKEIQPDRIYVLETDGETISNTFEWCKEGVESQIARLQKLSCDRYMNTWKKYLKGNTSVVIKDIEEIKEDDPLVYGLLKMQHIHCVINSPIYDNGKIIGYVGVDNYKEDETIDIQYLLESVAYFLSAKMVKERLLRRLDFLSHYDILTGVHNRNAMMEAIDALEKTELTVGIVYVDDNGLKKLNDTYGHFYGDIHIKKTANLLCKSFGENYVYRAGGDEFVVLVPGISESDFLSRFSQYEEFVKLDGHMSVAVGKEWIHSASMIKAAIHQADQKMYANKQEYYKKSEQKAR